MMKRSRLFAITFLILIFAFVLFVQAEEKSDKPDITKSLENIQVDLKLVISEKGKNDITYKYEFNVQGGDTFNFDIGSSKPSSAMEQPSENEKRHESKSGRYYSEGIMVTFKSSIEGKKIILKSTLQFSQTVLTGLGKDPNLRTFKIDAASVHQNAEQIKVFSGNFVEPDQTISLYVGAKRS